MTVEAALTEMIHFDYNVADLRPGDKQILDAKVSLLRMNPTVRIRITGNCDERGSDRRRVAGA